MRHAWLWLAASVHAAAPVDPLQRRFDATWRHNASARIVARSAGSWTSRADCPAPEFVLFLFGHLRSFWTLRRSWLDMLRQTAGDCWFVAVVTPNEVEYNYTNVDTSNLPPVIIAREKGSKIMYPATVREEITNGGRPIGDVMHTVQGEFDGRLAYAVVERGGDIVPWATCFEFYWSALSMVLDWAFDGFGVQLDSAAVVMRSRPDARPRFFLSTTHEFRSCTLARIFFAPFTLVGIWSRISADQSRHSSQVHASPHRSRAALAPRPGGRWLPVRYCAPCNTWCLPAWK